MTSTVRRQFAHLLALTLNPSPKMGEGLVRLLLPVWGEGAERGRALLFPQGQVLGTRNRCLYR